MFTRKDLKNLFILKNNYNKIKMRTFFKCRCVIRDIYFKLVFDHLMIFLIFIPLHADYSKLIEGSTYCHFMCRLFFP